MWKEQIKTPWVQSWPHEVRIMGSDLNDDGKSESSHTWS